MMWQHGGTHRANAFAEGGRESVENVHGWRKPLGELFITALRLIEFVGFPLKYSEDIFRRMTGFYLLCEWVGCKILSGLPLVLAEGPIEDGLKIWGGGRYLDVG